MLKCGCTWCDFYYNIFVLYDLFNFLQPGTSDSRPRMMIRRWAHRSKFYFIAIKSISISLCWCKSFFNPSQLYDIDRFFFNWENFLVRLLSQSKTLLSNFLCLFLLCSRVYKKTSSNQLLTLYLGTRELVSRSGVVEPIKGIIYIDPKVIESNQKVYCQLTLTFRWVTEIPQKCSSARSVDNKFCPPNQ